MRSGDNPGLSLVLSRVVICLLSFSGMLCGLLRQSDLTIVTSGISGTLLMVVAMSRTTMSADHQLVGIFALSSLPLLWLRSELAPSLSFLMIVSGASLIRCLASIRHAAPKPGRHATTA